MLTRGYLIFLVFAVVTTRMDEHVAHRLPGNLPVSSCVCISGHTIPARLPLCPSHLHGTSALQQLFATSLGLFVAWLAFLPPFFESE